MRARLSAYAVSSDTSQTWKHAAQFVRSWMARLPLPTDSEETRRFIYFRTGLPTVCGLARLSTRETAAHCSINSHISSPLHHTTCQGVAQARYLASTDRFAGGQATSVPPTIRRDRQKGGSTAGGASRYQLISIYVHTLGAALPAQPASGVRMHAWKLTAALFLARRLGNRMLSYV